MDTDSLYFALSDSKLEDAVRPELKVEFDNCKKDWLAWNTFSNRTPGLFKIEFEGHRAISATSLMVRQKVNTRARECRHGTTG